MVTRLREELDEELVEVESDGVRHLRVLIVRPVVAPAVLEDTPEVFRELFLG